MFYTKKQVQSRMTDLQLYKAQAEVLKQEVANISFYSFEYGQRILKTILSNKVYCDLRQSVDNSPEWRDLMYDFEDIEDTLKIELFQTVKTVN